MRNVNGVLHQEAQAGDYEAILRETREYIGNQLQRTDLSPAIITRAGEGLAKILTLTADDLASGKVNASVVGLLRWAGLTK